LGQNNPPTAIPQPQLLVVQLEKPRRQGAEKGYKGRCLFVSWLAVCVCVFFFFFL
jgi:hypothetical protein